MDGVVAVVAKARSKKENRKKVRGEMGTNRGTCFAFYLFCFLPKEPRGVTFPTEESLNPGSAETKASFVHIGS